MQKIKQGDDVVVLAGKDKGKRGTVLQVLNNGKLLVNDVNVVKKHVKPNPNQGQPGGIVEREAPIHASNLGLYNPITKKADRVGIKVLEDNRKVRVFRSSGEVVDVS